MRLALDISTLTLTDKHPIAPNRRTVYASVTIGRRTFWLQRWARMAGMKPEQARVGCPVDSSMVWGCGARQIPAAR